MQHTLFQSASLSGVGLHSGQNVTMRVQPAPVDHGIIFIRVDCPNGRNVIPALWDRVSDTRLCTVIENEFGARVGTIEHLMAALRGCGVDNARIEINGPEVPIMDGSAMPFVEAIERAGLREQSAPRCAIKVLREIEVSKNGKRAALRSATHSLFDGEIDFDHSHIGRQSYGVQLLNGNFRHDIAEARTFGFAGEVEYLRRNGLARGGSLENAIVLDDSGVLNHDGLRFNDEFIRHKILDAIGDLYLAGAPILGAYTSYKAGHELNNMLLAELFSDARNWTMVEYAQSPQPHRLLSAAGSEERQALPA